MLCINILEMIKQILTKVINKLKEILRTHPNVRKLIQKIVDTIWIINFKIKNLITSNSHSEKSSNIIYVNPKKIKFEIMHSKPHWRFTLKQLKPLFQIGNRDFIEYMDGDWDLKENLKQFKNSMKYKSFYQHFVENVAWEDTEYYELEKIGYLQGNVLMEYENIAELNKRFEYLDNLYSKIKQQGYKTQRKLIKTHGFFADYGRGSNLRRVDDEITVAIGRDGNIIFLDGRHRLAITKILGLDRIPVKVLICHPRWREYIKKRKEN